MTLPDHQVHGWISSLVDRTADQLRAELSLLVRRVQDAAPMHEVLPADAPVSSPAPLWEPREPLAARRVSGGDGPESGLGIAADVLDAVKELDEAASLTEILNVLVDRTSVHADRVLLVVARGDALIGWRWHGHRAEPGDATTLAIGPDDQRLIMRAARSGRTEPRLAEGAGQPDENPATQSRAAIAVPLLVEGQVVAVLHAEADPDADANAAEIPGVVRNPWPDVVCVLARHAARCLESMTARRLQELTRMPVTADTAQAPPAS